MRVSCLGENRTLRARRPCVACSGTRVRLAVPSYIAIMVERSKGKSIRSVGDGLPACFALPHPVSTHAERSIPTMQVSTLLFISISALRYRCVLGAFKAC